MEGSIAIAASPKRAIGFIRVCTAEQAGEKHSSLDTQAVRIQAHCQTNSLSLITTFTDILSGKRDDRTRYN